MGHFPMGGETYGVNVMQVQEVLRYTDVAAVPGAPTHVLGIINLRGTVVTVMDTRQRFALSQGEITDSTRIVIVETGEHTVGILVNSVAEVVYLKQSEIENPPNTGHDETARFIQGVCKKNGELLILLELEKLLTSDEWSEIEAQ